MRSESATVGTFETVIDSRCSKCDALCALCARLTDDYVICPSCVDLLTIVLLEGPNNQKETWRSIPGFNGYDVSSIGRIRSWKVKGSNTARLAQCPWLLKTPQAATGYLMVCLSFTDGRQRSYPVHRLVALAFVGIPKPGEVCRHLNDNKLDNRPCNLAWGTQRENVLDSIRNGNRTGERASSAKLTKAQVIAILESKDKARALATFYGVSIHTIYNIRFGKTWKELPRA
jgi:hypothetical protein